ncbi:hypothetical protein ACS72_10645, partial [Acinetobacter sp. VT 511]
ILLDQRLGIAEIGERDCAQVELLLVRIGKLEIAGGVHGNGGQRAYAVPVDRGCAQIGDIAGGIGLHGREIQGHLEVVGGILDFDLGGAGIDDATDEFEALGRDQALLVADLDGPFAGGRALFELRAPFVRAALW